MCLVTKCGTFTVKVSTAASDTHTAGTETSPTLTVNKANDTATAPTAKTVTYYGSAQELVNAGSTNDGTMYYAVTTENTAPTDKNLYTTSIPAKTNAGTYYVWYKAAATDDNHKDSMHDCVTVSVTIPCKAIPWHSAARWPETSLFTEKNTLPLPAKVCQYSLPIFTCTQPIIPELVISIIYHVLFPIRQVKI